MGRVTGPFTLALDERPDSDDETSHQCLSVSISEKPEKSGMRHVFIYFTLAALLQGLGESKQAR